MRDDDGSEVAVRVVFHEALLLPSPGERLSRERSCRLLTGGPL
jgi:hypothetical protein